MDSLAAGSRDPSRGNELEWVFIQKKLHTHHLIFSAERSRA